MLQLPPIEWLGLEIVRTEQGGETNTSGAVEFITHYRKAGAAIGSD